MSYDARPGLPFTPKFRITDTNGSAVTGGIVGTMTVYGPASGTASIASGALAHQGDGYWGLSLAGSLLTSLGTYTWSTGAISGTATLAAQSGAFVVGRGDLPTLRELLTDVRLALRDGFTGTTTGAGTTTTLVSARFAFGSNNRWKGSELFLFEPGNAADLNPVTVTGFAAATGTFTFAGQAITATVSGQDFILGNREGRGWRHEEVINALSVAIRRQRQPRAVWDQVAITTDTRTFEYAVPRDWIAVDTVEYRPPLNYPTLWKPISRVYWRFSPERGLLTLELPQWNLPLRIGGRATPGLPGGMNDLVRGDGAALRDDALYELLSASADPGDRQRAAMLGGGVMRGRVGAQMGRL